jgi:hypothetical protein
MTTPAPTAPTWQSLRVLGLTLVSAPAVIVLALWFVLGSEDDAFAPPLWALAVPVVLLAGGAAVINTIGYQVSREAPGDPAARFQALMMIRFVFAEAPFIASMALAFVVPQGGFAVVLLAAVGATVLLLWHVLPNDGQVQRLERAYASAGHPTDLRGALHAS